MRGEPVFLGVYVKTSDTDSGSSAVHAKRWHAWGLADGSFLVQETPQDDAQGKKQDSPEADVQRLSVDDFFTGFRVFSAFSSKHKPSFPRAGQENPARPEADEAPREASAPSRARPASAPETVPPTVAEAAPPPPTQKPDDRAASEQDLVSYLTKGLGEDLGKDYVLVKSKHGKSGSGYQAQAVIQYEEEPAHEAAVNMGDEEIARIEESFRTDFSLSLIKMKSKRDDALKSLERLARGSGPFAREHKFMFTDCGLALRKRNLYVLAQQFHERAMLLSPDDEHVLFNLARVMYECGKTEKAREYLAKSVEMAPDFQAGRDFLSFIDGDMPLRR